MIGLSVKRPVAAASVYAALLALGVFSFRSIPLEDLPDVALPSLTVRASWPGASPEAMEAAVTAPLEAVAQQVRGVKKIISVSAATSRGSGSSASISVEFERDTRMEFARLELSERIASVMDEMPPFVVPTVSEFVPVEFRGSELPLLSFQLTGPHTSARLGEIAEEQVAPTIRAMVGVAEVTVAGAQEREVTVELDRDLLETLGILPGEVGQRIFELAQPRAPGSVELQGRRWAVSVRTRALEPAELEDIVVRSGPGGVIRVGDLGRVRDGTAEPTGYTRVNGHPAVTLTVDRRTGANEIRVAGAVRNRMEELVSGLPPGLELRLLRDRSERIAAQLGDLRLRAIASALVIFLVLVVFLRSIAAVSVIFLTIGFCVLIAVNLLFVAGLTLNLLTMAGLAWGFGLVVDNGIVVMENVDRHRGRGKPRALAAVDGARQVWLPVLAATATTAVVLVPFIFLQGDLRVYYLPLAYAVGFSILASLAVAFTFVPALSARLASRRRATAPAGTDPAYIRFYRAMLEWGMARPGSVLAICAACLYGSWYLFDENVYRGATWPEGGASGTSIVATVRFPRGAGLERTDELIRRFESRLQAEPGVERFESQVWPTFGRIVAFFPDALTYTSIPASVHQSLVSYGRLFSGVEVSVVGQGPAFMSGMGASSIPSSRAKILGYNYLTVQQIAEDLAESLRGIARVRNVNPNASGGSSRAREFEYYVRPDRERLAEYPVSVRDMLRYVGANARVSEAAARLRIGGEEVRYAVKTEGYRDFDLFDLQQMRVPTPDGEVALGNVADVGEREVLAQILRQDQQYERTVSWEVRGSRRLADMLRETILAQVELPPGYFLEEDTVSWTREEQIQVWQLVLVGLSLIYMVTAALFESLRAPLVVLCSIPFALIGVFLIFFYTDSVFDRTALVGTVMMGGIVVNNAILVVYHIGQLRKTLPARDAIVRGTLERVRPILMTTATTVMGLLPLVLFSPSQSANLWNSLALATMGGLLSSTFFVLLAIPVIYKAIAVPRTS